MSRCNTYSAGLERWNGELGPDVRASRRISPVFARNHTPSASAVFAIPASYMQLLSHPGKSSTREVDHPLCPSFIALEAVFIPKVRYIEVILQMICVNEVLV